jgi:hypothetical protein
MPYTIAFNEKQGGVITTFSGQVTAEEVFNSVIDRFADARGTDVTYSIGDYTNISGLEFTAPDARGLAERAREVMRRQQNLIVAIVAPSNVAFGLGRMVEIHSEEPDTMAVFRTMAEAEAWIAQKLQVREPRINR